MAADIQVQPTPINLNIQGVKGDQPWLQFTVTGLTGVFVFFLPVELADSFCDKVKEQAAVAKTGLIVATPVVPKDAADGQAG